MLELVIDAGAIGFGFAVEERSDGVEAREVGELVEVDPIALRLDHAVIADDDEIDGQVGGLERGFKLADDCIHFKFCSAGLRRIGTEFVALVIGLGIVDGDEVRAIGGRQTEQRDSVVDARLLRLRRALGFVVEVRIPGWPEAGDLRF